MSVTSLVRLYFDEIMHFINTHMIKLIRGQQKPQANDSNSAQEPLSVLFNEKL